jgi:hypothetical protein
MKRHFNRRKITTKSAGSVALTQLAAAAAAKPRPNKPVLDFEAAKEAAIKLVASTGQAKKFRARPTPGVMNKTEERYARYLEEQRRLGAVVDWLFAPASIRLADGLHFLPDFFVVFADGAAEFVDVKAHDRKRDKALAEEDATVKIKAAAERWWMFGWVQTWRDENGWQRREFGSRMNCFPNDKGEQDARAQA